MENILGVGGITISDLNDALISGDAPRNPDEGALWIDSSANTPVLKVYKNGSWQPQEIDVSNLDPELSETVTTIVNTLGTLADDGLLTYADRLQLSVEIASIIGEIPSKQNGNVYPNTLPAYDTIDSLGVGSFSSLRQTARDATVPTDNTYYIALEQAYTELNTYLSSLTPRPWDVTLTNKDTNTEVANPDAYREALLNYYLAEMNLATYTEKRALDATKEYTDASVQDAITSVDVEYATSTDSKTVPGDDEWETLAPTWDNGIFIWSRTLTTYKNGSTFISDPVNITGAKGESGGAGNDGKGISSIIGQYYLSDSKETRSGGSWETTAPKWEQGKYMWTRSQIKWINPTDTTYTEPIVDTSWEAVVEATKGVGLSDKTETLSGTEIYTDKADDDSVVHVEVDGKSVQDGEPSPDSPKDIQSVNDFDIISQKYTVNGESAIDGIEVGGRNLIRNSNRFNFTPRGGMNLVVDNDADLVVEEWGATNATKIRLVDSANSTSLLKAALHDYSYNPYIVGEIYTFSFFIRNDRDVDVPIIIELNAFTDYEPVRIEGGESKKVIITGKKNDNNFPQVRFMAQKIVNNLEFTIWNYKVEKGNKATDWTPAPEDITEDTNHPLIDKINLLLSEPLRSVGDVKDRLFRDNDGLWKVERNVGGKILDGSESWVMPSNSAYSDTVRRFNLSNSIDAKGVPDDTHIPLIVSNMFNPGQLNYSIRTGNGITQSTPGTHLYVFTDKASSLSEFKTFLSNSNLEVIYENANPTIETLDQELQDKLNNLRSFQDSNYVYTIISDKTDIISEKLKPTLHATFKGGGWYNRFKTGSEVERLDTKITDSMEEVSSAVNAEWIAEAESIRGDVEATYVSANDFETLQTDISTTFKQTETAFDFRFNEAEKLVSEVGGNIETLENEIKKYIRFVDGSIILGAEGSTSEVIITNEKISFMQGGEDPVAFIEGQKMQINHGIFVDSATIAGFKFEIVQGTTGVLGITWTDN